MNVSADCIELLEINGFYLHEETYFKIFAHSSSLIFREYSIPLWCENISVSSWSNNLYFAAFARFSDAYKLFTDVTIDF